MQFPIQLSEDPLVIGTLKVRITMQREMILAARKQGIGADELQNLVAQKEMEVQEYLGKMVEDMS